MKRRLTGRWTTSGSGAVRPPPSGRVVRSGSLRSPSLPTPPDGGGGLGITESDSLPKSECIDIETFLSRPHTLNYWAVGVSVTLTQRDTLLDLRGNIPSIIVITHGKVHDVNILDQLVFEAGATYVMDRGYLDFKRLYKITLAQAFFVTRAKSNFVFKRLYSLPVDKSTGVLSDQIITLSSFYPSKGYPDKLRRIRFYDAATNNRLVFLTNNFTLSALVIAQLYRSRWQVELFFKWIKQHLRIKAFYGTTQNALKTQIWIAISVYVLVAIVKKRLNLGGSLYRILQILSVSVFEKTPLLQALSDVDYKDLESGGCNQLTLWE